MFSYYDVEQLSKLRAEGFRREVEERRALRSLRREAPGRRRAALLLVALARRVAPATQRVRPECCSGGCVVVCTA